jgi:hypothetical protein
MGKVTDKFGKELQKHILEYMKSEGPGGKRVISAFLEEFEKLSERSPQDDPTNIKNHLTFLVKHIKETWDESLQISEDGNIRIGICKDEILGFTEDKEKLKHNPAPTVWIVYLIRGIGGRFAFVNPEMYYKKKKETMPSQYFGGFLISKYAWDREGWGVLGDFSKFEHPACGASSVPFFKNVRERVNFQELIGEAIADFQAARGE